MHRRLHALALLLATTATFAAPNQQIGRAISDDPDPVPLRTVQFVSPLIDNDIRVVELGTLTATPETQLAIWISAIGAGQYLPLILDPADVLRWEEPADPLACPVNKAECEAQVNDTCGLVGSSRDINFEVTQTSSTPTQGGSCSGQCQNGVSVNIVCPPL